MAKMAEIDAKRYDMRTTMTMLLLFLIMATPAMAIAANLKKLELVK